MGIAISNKDLLRGVKTIASSDNLKLSNQKFHLLVYNFY